MTLMNVPDAELKLALVRTCGVGTIGSALGLPLSLPELLDDLALLPVLGRSLGGLLAGRDVPFFSLSTSSPALASVSFLLRSSTPPLQRFMPMLLLPVRVLYQTPG